MNDSVLCDHTNGVFPEFIITLPDSKFKCKLCGKIIDKSENGVAIISNSDTTNKSNTKTYLYK